MSAKHTMYIVLSFTNTLPGRLIITRAALRFWDRYEGDSYSHVSLAFSAALDDMYSFSRKGLHNPLNAGFVHENIREGLYGFRKKVSRICVIRVPVSSEQWFRLVCGVKACREHAEQLRYNFLGLFSQLFWGRGLARKNHYFCSQWLAEQLNSAGIPLFDKKPVDVRPFDYYAALKKRIVFEGTVEEYLNFLAGYADEVDLRCRDPKLMTSFSSV